MVIYIFCAERSDMISIRAMCEKDIETILFNYNEQGWSKPREVLEKYIDENRTRNVKINFKNC